MKKVLCKIMGLVALVSFLLMLYSVAGVEQMEEGFSLWEPLVPFGVFCASGWIVNRLYEED